MNTPFVPSDQWQDVPDWAAVPNGGHYRMNPNTGINQARWDLPIPPASSVIDKRTLPGANGQQSPAPASSPAVPQSSPLPANPSYVQTAGPAV